MFLSFFFFFETIYWAFSTSQALSCTLLYCVWTQSYPTPWTVAHQVPLSMGFPRQEYWSGLPCHLLHGIFPTQGLNPHLLYCRQILCLLSYWGWICIILFNPQLSTFGAGITPSLQRRWDPKTLVTCLRLLSWLCIILFNPQLSTFVRALLLVYKGDETQRV